MSVIALKKTEEQVFVKNELHSIFLSYDRKEIKVLRLLKKSD